MPDFPHRRTPLKAELKAKNAELEKIRIRARTIIEEHKQGLPAEQEVAVKALLEKASELKAEIDAETKMDDYKADLAKLDAFIDDPVRKVPHGINGDASECKALERQGWEFKGGLAYAPTSLGKTYPMFGQDVLFGDIPTNDPDQARFFKTTRASMSAEYKAAYAQLIRNTAKAQNDAMAYGMLTNAEQKALSEGSDTAGGFLVPPDVQAELLVRTAQMAVMRQYARVQTTNRDVLKWPAVAANTTSGFTSIYSSGFVGGWVGETPAFSDTDPAFQTFEVPIRKLRVVTKLSNDFVADAAVNILAFLASNGAENMALVEDYGFFQGLGSALQPTGILNAGISTFSVEGSTTDTISNTTSNTGSAPKIITGAYTLPSQYAGRARWVMRRTIEGKVRGLVDASGRPLWPPQTGSGFAAAPADLLGSSVVNTDFMPDDGTDANKVLLYGDLSNYIIGQRAQITSIVLRERFADTDQVGVVLFERVGGGVFNPDAFRIGIV
jgi:HK97 family phage major capsid protein